MSSRQNRNHPIQLKRVYEPPATGDGERFLVERLWPRGIKKTDLPMTAWLRDVAPSPELRTWFAHDPEKWPEFQRRYTGELDTNPGAWRPLVDALEHGPVTLLFAARDTERNSAALLKRFLEEKLHAGR